MALNPQRGVCAPAEQHRQRDSVWKPAILAELPGRPILNCKKDWHFISVVKREYCQHLRVHVYFIFVFKIWYKFWKHQSIEFTLWSKSTLLKKFRRLDYYWVSKNIICLVSVFWVYWWGWYRFDDNWLSISTCSFIKWELNKWMGNINLGARLS